MPYLIDMSFVLPLKALSRKDAFFHLAETSKEIWESLHRMIWNPSIYNIIVRWFAGSLGQMTCRPSVWCSKHYFFNFLELGHFYLCKFIKRIRKWIEMIFANLYEKKYLEHQTLAQRISVIYCRLSDLWSKYKERECC